MGSPHWSPTPGGSPAFQRYRAGETTVLCLTRTACELHHTKTLYNTLLEAAQSNEQEWSRQRALLEEQVRQLAVCSAEAERLFQEQLSQLTHALKSTEVALDSVSQEHEQHKQGSAEHIASLNNKISQLRDQCNQLENQRQELQRKVDKATMDAQKHADTERKCGELQRSIAALKERAQGMVDQLERQRDGLDDENSRLCSQLAATQHALQREAISRQQHENMSLQLAVERQRLAAALEVERMINEPLRSTNYASTTISHVMRSRVAPVVQSRSKTPHSPSHSSAPVDCASPPMGERSLAVLKPGSPGPGASTYITVTQPPMGVTAADRTLTRLGRSWATTTTTAGHPHPVYLDNVQPPLRPPTSPGVAVQTAAAPGLDRGQGVADTPSRAPTMGSPYSFLEYNVGQRYKAGGGADLSPSYATVPYSPARPRRR